MRLFWRVFWLNTLVGAVATVLLMVGPWTVSVPIRLTEALVLATGLAVMLAANAVLLWWGLAPLGRLARLMATVDLLRPGQRLPVTGSGEIAALIDTFNQMLRRLEAERGTSAARALSAQEDERRRVARELHDEIGQSLTALLLDLKRVTDTAPPQVRRDLRNAQEMTRESLDEVRRIARRLRPDVLEDLGLASALAALAARFDTHTTLRVRRQVQHGLPPLDPQVELVLYRVAQEALTNAARHSGAASVVLDLRADGDRGVLLRVEDDGEGLGGAPEGAGIRGMRERALLVGGALDLRTGPDGGTRLDLRVPTVHASLAGADRPVEERP